MSALWELSLGEEKVKCLQGVRCDVCAKLQGIMDVDTFMPFMIDWVVGRHPISGEQVSRWVHERQTPGIPVTLHACPTCSKKVAGFFETKDLGVLPTGPLKKILRSTLANPENKIESFRLHYMVAGS